jgi:hypothetical protein
MIEPIELDEKLNKKVEVKPLDQLPLKPFDLEKSDELKIKMPTPFDLVKYLKKDTNQKEASKPLNLKILQEIHFSIFNQTKLHEQYYNHKIVSNLKRMTEKK